MRRWPRLFLILGVALVALTVVGLGLVLAVRHEPSFYQDALLPTAAEREHASDELLETAAALASSAQKSGRWRVLFTAEQINGWLACDAPRNHPQLLPEEIVEPRVAIEDGRLRIACRHHANGVPVVLSVELEAHLTDTNEFSIRIHRARAGAVPLPLASVIDRITQAAHDLHLHIRWLQAGGDPVAVISIPPPRAGEGTRLAIEALQLNQGELFVAGHTSDGESYRPEDDQPAEPPVVLGESPENDTRTR